MKFNKAGQAMFEFIIFLPFVIVLFKMFLNIGGAINGSINQQKAARGYFYFTLRGGSYFPPLNLLNGALMGHQSVSFYALGYAEKLISDQPVSPCYKIEPFFGEDKDKCLDKIKGNESQFIKPRTMYGLCGPEYVFNGTIWQLAQTTPGSCTTR